jgi:hypothetical protein
LSLTQTGYRFCDGIVTRLMKVERGIALPVL